MKNRMFLHAAILLLASSPALAGNKTEAAIGGAIGGAVGAAVGHEVGGRDGAIIGGAVGGAAGAVVGADVGDKDGGRSQIRHDDHHYRTRVVTVESAPAAKSLPPGLAKKGKVPPGHAR